MKKSELISLIKEVIQEFTTREAGTGRLIHHDPNDPETGKLQNMFAGGGVDNNEDYDPNDPDLVWYEWQRSALSKYSVKDLIDEYPALMDAILDAESNSV